MKATTQRTVSITFLCMGIAVLLANLIVELVLGFEFNFQLVLNTVLALIIIASAVLQLRVAQKRLMGEKRESTGQ